MKRPQYCAGWVEDRTNLYAQYSKPPHEGMRRCYRARWADDGPETGKWYCCKAHREREEAIAYERIFPGLYVPEELDRIR